MTGANEDPTGQRDSLRLSRRGKEGTEFLSAMEEMNREWRVAHGYADPADPPFIQPPPCQSLEEARARVANSQRLKRHRALACAVASAFLSAAWLTAALGPAWATAIALLLVAPLTRFLVLRTKPSRDEMHELQELEEWERRAAEKRKREAEEAERRRQEAEAARREEAARLHRTKEFWRGLSGLEFETELGRVYRSLGYEVRATPATGDGGIDLFLRKDGRMTVVQCKAHAKPVPAASVDQTFAAGMREGADEAILASTGGFSRRAREAAIQLTGRPRLVLLDLDGILELQARANGDDDDLSDDEDFLDDERLDDE